MRLSYLSGVENSLSRDTNRVPDALHDELVDALSGDEAVLQAVVDQVPRAFQYYTDCLSGYVALDYRGDCL